MPRARISVAAALLLTLGLGLSAYAISDDPFLGGEPGFGRTQQILAGLGVLLAAGAALRPAARRRLLAATLATLATLALAELLLAQFAGCRLRQPYVYDSELLFALRPGACGEFRHLPANGGHTVRYRVNQDGFRGPELRTDGTLRVMVYGDSFVQAIYTAEEHTFARRLEHHLRQALGTEVEVVNAGIASYGPDQALLKMARELPKYRPDLVVMAVFAGNDFGDLERNKLFRLAADGTLVRNPKAQLADHLYQRFAVGARESLLKSALRRAGSAAEAAIPADVDRAADRDTALVEYWLQLALAEHASTDDVVGNVSVDFYNADVALLPEAPSSRQRVQLMAGVLARMQALAQQQKTPLFGLAIPHPMDVCEHYDTGRVDTGKYPGYRRTNLTDAVLAGWRAAGVPALDLFPLLAGGQCESRFLKAGDDHWSDLGQEFAAQQVAEALVRQGLVRKRG
ncbi:MAG: SGNH/GDSL hydrolase family protein [Planctomycetes bacterium]|nr:SGNH/GDSL hydrolase family protein [Planctomycetota bacterium]